MKLPLLAGRQVYGALRRLGFNEIHRKGSHVKRWSMPTAGGSFSRFTTRWIGTRCGVRFGMRTSTRRSSSRRFEGLAGVLRSRGQVRPLFVGSLGSVRTAKHPSPRRSVSWDACITGCPPREPCCSFR